MPDEIDLANERAALLLSVAIATKKQEPITKARGRCLCCGEQVPEGRRWCDKYCCTEWEKAHGR